MSIETNEKNVDESAARAAAAVAEAWKSQGLAVEARDADDDLLLAGGARRRRDGVDEDASDEDAG